MARTLKSKRLGIWRAVCLLNPGHGDVYISGLGLVQSEWTWCAQHLQTLRLAEPLNDRHHFNDAGIKLLTYIRYKHRNPV